MQRREAEQKLREYLRVKPDKSAFLRYDILQQDNREKCIDEVLTALVRAGLVEQDRPEQVSPTPATGQGGLAAETHRGLRPPTPNEVRREMLPPIS